MIACMVSFKLGKKAESITALRAGQCQRTGYSDMNGPEEQKWTPRGGRHGVGELQFERN